MQKAEGLPGPRLDHLLGLLALAAFLFFLGLGSLGLTDRDEGSNAEAAREMLETGNWVSPTLNYEPRFQKPAFTYWLTGLTYRLFGVSEFSARTPSAVFGVALILLQYWFLTRVRGSRIGLIGALMLLLNVEVLAIGRLVLTDSVLIFFSTLAIYAFWLGLHGEGRARHWFWLFYAGMALGTLTKGPVGFAVPLLAVVPYLTLTRRWGEYWRRGFPLAGFALFFALAVPWYAVMLAIHGSRYTESARADTIGRFLTVIGGHGGTILFYVPVLLFGYFPWSGLLPPALYVTYRDWRRARGEARGATGEEMLSMRLAPGASRLANDLDLFAALWLVAVFVFFSLSATRLPHYIGPLFPAAAILTSSYWLRALADPATPGIRASFRTMMVLGYLLGLLLAASSNLYSAFVDKIAKEFPAAPLTSPGTGPPAAGLALLLGVGLVWYFGRTEERRAGAFWVAAATLITVALIAVVVTLPRFSHYFVAPPQELAYTAGVNLGPEDRLIWYGRPRPSLVFYARRKIIVIKPGEEEAMRPYLTQPGRTLILLPARLRSNLPPEAKDYALLLQRYGYLLLANQPMVRQPPAGVAPAAPPFHSFPAPPGAFSPGGTSPARR